MPIQIRKATPHDASAIAKIHVETWQDAYRGLIPDEYLDNLSIPKRLMKWTKMLSDKNDETIYLVGLIENEILGWATFSKCMDEDTKSNWGQLGGIYVLPVGQGKGIGSALMQEGLSQLKLRGYEYATLWVLTNNLPAKEFYESKGWKIEGKTKVDHRNGVSLDETRYIITL